MTSTVPPGRGLSASLTRHFVPGYDQPVPPGQNRFSPSIALFGQAVPLAKLQIDFQHVDQLFPSQSGKWCRNILLQDLVDLSTDLSGIMLGVLSPLGGYPIQLKLGVCQCDVRVEAEPEAVTRSPGTP